MIGAAVTVPRPTRAIWMVVGVIAVAAFTVLGSLHVVSVLAHEETTVTRSFGTDGLETLEVHAESGDVRIVGADEGEIRVTAAISEGLRETGHRVEREGRSLVVESSCPNFLSVFCWVDYTIRAPVDLDVVVRGGGGVSVSDLRGDVDVETDDGDLTAQRLEGEVRLRSSHGSISASLSTAPELVDTETDHGEIDVVVPRGDEVYRVDASSGHGSVETPIRQDPSARRVIRAVSDHGDVSIRYPAR